MLVGAELRRIVRSAAPAGLTVALIIGTVSVASPAGPVAAAFACSSTTAGYTVEAGDSWYAIAQRMGVTPNALLGANDAEVRDVLYPGDRLCLPPGAKPGTGCSTSTYTVASGDSWYGIAGRVRVSPSSLVRANDAVLSRVLFPGDQLCLPSGAAAPASLPSASSPGAASSSGSSGSSSASTYTVVSGDSWAAIARRATVSMSSLLSANDATTATVLLPGDVLRLPAGAVSPTRSPAARANVTVELAALPTQGPCWYADTWYDYRAFGRRHVGTDLFTLPRQYVYAVADGRLTGRDWDQPSRISGNAWTLTAADGTFFYYAHLAAFASGLEVGSRVTAGQIIGWVGATGKVSAEHLHFEIHPQGGEAVNPYPTLKAMGGCNRGAPYTQPGGWVPDRIG